MTSTYLNAEALPYSGWARFVTFLYNGLMDLSQIGIAFDRARTAAIVNVIFGYLVGEYINQKGRTWEMLSNLFMAGVAFTLTGYLWDMSFPINKKIWTSSYTMYTVGLATVTLASLIYAIEFKGKAGAWSRFFDVFGKNPLFIFAFSAVVVKTYGLIRISDGTGPDGKPLHKNLAAWMYDHLFSPAFGEFNGSLLFAVAHIIVFWAIVRWMDKKRIYVKV